MLQTNLKTVVYFVLIIAFVT